MASYGSAKDVVIGIDFQNIQSLPLEKQLEYFLQLKTTSSALLTESLRAFSFFLYENSGKFASKVGLL
jgi:hypothetical protein